jgi:CRP/FNR family transcriptional regulator, dissimilatory nitrate respiration regulator
MTAPHHKAFPIALTRCTSRVRLDSGQPVFRAGAAPRYIHFVEEGTVRLVRHGLHGEEVVLHHARPGEFVAEASLDSARYHCDAVACEPSTLLRVAKADLEQLITSDTTFAREWIALLAAQLRGVRARVERLSLRSAEDRIRHLLLSEGRGPQHEFVPAGSLKYLARTLGLTHETLYRSLARMQKKGVIQRQGLRIRLADQGNSFV